jgi:hypothetical protein
MKKMLQPSVPSRIARHLYGLVVLAQELAALPLRQVSQDELRVVGVLYLSRLGGHVLNLHPGPDTGLRRRIRVSA